jgi:hypothetical protein
MTLRPMVTPTRPWWLAATGRPTPRPSSDLAEVDVKVILKPRPVYFV